ncbi:hypothetical protein JZ751_025506 [Albula glossodonta]|uniref:Uncharacterized protein n=1 Tax=Albula glossodonta TaxID=121402 RepID=A0A8T2NM60_9TELE|nr:hypothetical protein JZ751_025506 [Albula glossodonta]
MASPSMFHVMISDCGNTGSQRERKAERCEAHFLCGARESAALLTVTVPGQYLASGRQEVTINHCCVKSGGGDATKRVFLCAPLITGTE